MTSVVGFLYLKEKFMSKRVYEIARELNLSTKEVIERLNDAGIEVKSPLAVVEDPLVERVFGDGLKDLAPNGRSEGQEAGALPSMIQSPQKRSPARRVSLYILVAVLVFGLAASIGALATLIVQGNLSWPESEKPRSSDQQGNAPQHQGGGAVADRSQQKETEKETEKETGAQQEAKAASQQSEGEYVARVGEIQRRSVETFLDSHEKLMRYDALSSDDVEKMHTNQATLKEFASQVDGLDPPQKYKEHYEVFRSAINELYEAARLAYELAADPLAATQSQFDEHDRHVDQAAARLQQSNEILGRDYKSIEGARMEEISPF